MFPSQMSCSLDYNLWKACAGGAVRVPAIGSRVVYFPEGHTEYSTSPPDFSTLPSFQTFFNCTVTAVSLHANTDSDEVYAQISLDPSAVNVAAATVTSISPTSTDEESASSSFAKVLTPSDANNGGGFSVPRFCAESIFPPLDHSMDPPSQIIYVIDVHGRTWKFRHIYRGTPRRHLLTSGWSDFVNSKKLIAGDTVVFVRNLAGQLFVGIRRSGRSYGEPISFDTRKKQESRCCSNVQFLRGTKGRVIPESVVEAVRFAAMGKPFDVLFYPRVGLPEFVVDKDMVETAMAVAWGPGMRIKMAIEPEDSSRTTWIQGTVACAAVPEHGRWARSMWRMLQIAWDEPEVLQRLRAVCPWHVELMPSILEYHIAKKPKFYGDLNLSADGHGSMSFPVAGIGNTGMESLAPSLCDINVSPSSIQGARQIFSSLSTILVPMSTKEVISGKRHGLDMPWHPNMLKSEGITPVVQDIIHQNVLEISGVCKPTMKLRKGSILLFGQIIETEQIDDSNVSVECSLPFTHNHLLDKQIRVSAVGACE